MISSLPGTLPKTLDRLTIGLLTSNIQHHFHHPKTTPKMIIFMTDQLNVFSIEDRNSMRPKLDITSLDHIASLLKTLNTFFQDFIFLFYDKHFKAIKQGFPLLSKGNIYDEKFYFRNISLNHYKGLSLQRKCA